MTNVLNKLAEGLGIVPNNTIANKEVDLNNLNNNPYDGTFKQVYDLVVDGKIAPLAQGAMVIGVDVKAPDGYTDSEANYYYGKAYGYEKGTYYPLLAMQLVTANLIPQEIVDDGTSNLKVKILGNKWLNMRGNETTAPVKPEPKPEVANADDENTYTYEGVEYKLIRNADNGRPNLARVDGEAIPNRKKVAKGILIENGYAEYELEDVGTNTLERWLRPFFNAYNI